MLPVFFTENIKILEKNFIFLDRPVPPTIGLNESGKDSTGKKALIGSSWGVGVDFFPGIAYKVSKHFFLELSIPEFDQHPI